MSGKIALFIPSLMGGGAEKVFVLLANSLQDHGMHVDMLLSTTSGKYFSLLDKNIRVVDFHSRQLFFTLPQLIGYLRTEKPDILLSAVENANTWALIAKKLSGTSTPVMITEHNNWSQILSHQPSLKEKLLFQIARLVYPWADRIVAVSSGIRTDLLQMIRLDPQQVICIFNPVVPPDLPSLTVMPVEHPWLKNKEKPVLISIGRLVLQKDFETLIQAFDLVKKQIACRLIILGEGPERKNLQAIIEKLGLQADIDMPGWLKAICSLCHPATKACQPC